MHSGSNGQQRWRILVALLVYNGEAFVRPCLASLARLDNTKHDIDVLILDDASPAPGWSDRCQELAASYGFGYYRTPRNLGIPRNMNLGLLYAESAKYDAVLLLNSDTVVPKNLVNAVTDPLVGDSSISSVTAWSNNVSVYSIPSEFNEKLAESNELVDWISAQLENEFRGQIIDIPSAMGFAMCVPTSVIGQVGIMDPVFGRGYSEEIDWCLRTHIDGYRSVLALSCFVYHAGSGINKAEGLIGGDDRLVQAHQAIIDTRYPLYMSHVDTFMASELPQKSSERAVRAIVVQAARERGYCVDVGWLAHRDGNELDVRFVVEPDGPVRALRGFYAGFEYRQEYEGGALQALEEIVGTPPREVRLRDQGPHSEAVVQEVSRTMIPVRPARYQERVF